MRYPATFAKAGYPDRWFKVYLISEKSKKKIASDTIFIGDSVGAQFFPYTDSPNYIPVNGAILMSGQYIIMANAIETNPHLKCIVLVLRPESLGMQFDNPMSYNNFVKPFYLSKNFDYLSDSLKQKIETNRYAPFFKYPFFKFLPLSDIDYSKNDLEVNSLSDTSIEYLKKMMDLCEEKKITLRLLSPPLEQSFLQKSNDWATMRKQVQTNQLEPLFKDYFKDIKYLSEEYFTDGVHLQHDIIHQQKAMFLTVLNKEE